MRILLVNPPAPSGALTNRDLMGGMGIDDRFGETLPARFIAFAKYEGIHLPVLTLAYAAAIVRAAGHTPIVLDLARLSPHNPATLQAALDAQPDWVISATSFAYLGSELDWLAQLHAKTGCQRLLFGATAGHFAEEILRRGLCEAIALGDPEVAFGHLVAGTLRPGVAGAAMTEAGPQGRTVRNGGQGWLADLAQLPWPDWSGFEVAQYGYHPLLKRRPMLTMQASRGCPYACDFCPYPVGQGAPFRPRPVADVVAEMTDLANRYGVRSILFRDATFTLDMSRARELARAITAAQLDVQWGIETRLDRLDDDLLVLLAQAGCKTITFGLDPIEPETCKASHRKAYAPDRAKVMIARMRELGITTAGLYVVGLPLQDEAELQRTMDWIDGLALSYVNYEQATVFPGTSLYTQAVANGWASDVTLDELMQGEPKLHFNGRMNQAEIRALQDQALQRFYTAPRRVLGELSDREVGANLRFYARTAWRFARSSLTANDRDA